MNFTFGFRLFSTVRQCVVVVGVILAFAATRVSTVLATPITLIYEGFISSTDAPLASVNGQTLQLEYTFASTEIDQNPFPIRGFYPLTSLSP